jgi:hypothetical protein
MFIMKNNRIKKKEYQNKQNNINKRSIYKLVGQIEKN